jgi:hypothetical protein
MTWRGNATQRNATHHCSIAPSHYSLALLQLLQLLLRRHARLRLAKHSGQKHRTMQTTSIAPQEGPP